MEPLSLNLILTVWEKKISAISSTIAMSKKDAIPKTVRKQKTRNSFSNLYIGDY